MILLFIPLFRHLTFYMDSFPYHLLTKSFSSSTLISLYFLCFFLCLSLPSFLSFLSNLGFYIRFLFFSIWRHSFNSFFLFQLSLLQTTSFILSPHSLSFFLLLFFIFINLFLFSANLRDSDSDFVLRSETAACEVFPLTTGRYRLWEDGSSFKINTFSTKALNQAKAYQSWPQCCQLCL